MEKKTWYISVGGETQGPFDAKEVRRLNLVGRLKSTDYVFKEGMTDWVEYGKSELSEMASRKGTPNADSHEVCQQASDSEESATVKRSGKRTAFMIACVIFMIACVIATCALGILALRQRRALYVYEILSEEMSEQLYALKHQHEKAFKESNDWKLKAKEKSEQLETLKKQYEKALEDLKVEEKMSTKAENVKALVANKEATRGKTVESSAKGTCCVVDLVAGIVSFKDISNFSGSVSQTFKRDKILLKPVPVGDISLGIEGSVNNPRRHLRIGPLYVGMFEVTQGQYERVMYDNPSIFKSPDRPVERVSYSDALRFINRLNAMTGRKFRLPTEDEWEYACRAGSKGDWGRRIDGSEGPLDAMGWYGMNNVYEETHPVGEKESNAWGLYDMHGNVAEWTSTADGDSRVHRGGGWDSDSRRCSAGNRRWLYPDLRNGSLGFRLVLQD